MNWKSMKMNKFLVHTTQMKLTNVLRKRTQELIPHGFINMDFKNRKYSGGKISE